MTHPHVMIPPCMGPHNPSSHEQPSLMMPWNGPWSRKFFGRFQDVSVNRFVQNKMGYIISQKDATTCIIWIMKMTRNHSSGFLPPCVNVELLSRGIHSSSAPCVLYKLTWNLRRLDGEIGATSTSYHG